jgi:hypothetical protein
MENIVIINGRPRHPQTQQGLVERGNQTLESAALGKWMQSNNCKEGSKGGQIDRLATVCGRKIAEFS